MCVTAAEEKQRLRPAWDAPVFILNCLVYLQDVLGTEPFVEQKRNVIDALVQERVNRLIEEHYINVLHDTGLAEAVAVLDGNSDEPLSRLSATTPQTLLSSLRRFADWLSTPDVLHSPRLMRLTGGGSPHALVHRAALERVARAYRRLCEAVRDPKNRYEAAATLLGSERPFGQVNLLLQIFGLGEEVEEL
jgi:hypothetical protein